MAGMRKGAGVGVLCVMAVGIFGLGYIVYRLLLGGLGADANDHVAVCDILEEARHCLAPAYCWPLEHQALQARRPCPLGRGSLGAHYGAMPFSPILTPLLQAGQELMPALGLRLT